jgi:serine phosphatase RsbU (regulator of sigma subunit)
MHQSLRELPGPRTKMEAVAVHWNPSTGNLRIANCGHVAPIVLRENGEAEQLPASSSGGLGGRATPKPSEEAETLRTGDRLVVVSDGVTGPGAGQAGLGIEGLIDAARRSELASAADTVREVHAAVRRASGEKLTDDATAVCLAVG